MITQFYFPVKAIFGTGSIDQLGQEAKLIGKKAIIVTYPDIHRVGILDKVINNLHKNDIETIIFEEVQPNPRSTMIDRGARIARNEKVDLVIGLGGGSAMDAAKGISLAAGSDESIWDYITSKAQIKGRTVSLIQIPTLAGTGSELNPAAVITNWETHDKRVFANPVMWAKLAFIDPSLTITVPETYTASGGVDIFSHLVEYYLMSEMPLPLNDAIREAVMGIVVKYLPQVLAKPDDIEARTQLSWASSIAMSQFAKLGGTVGAMTCHSIEHAVSGYYDISHGAGLAALLPAWMKHILPVRKDRLVALGKNVFGKFDGILATEDWLEKVGMRIRLHDLGCDIDSADKIAEIVMRSPVSLTSHPRALDANAVAQIYCDSC